MAKKTNNEVLVPAIPTGVQGQIALTKEDLAQMGVGDDLVKVGIARARKKLQAQLSDIQQEIEDTEADIKKQDKAAEALAVTIAEKHTEQAANVAPSFFQTLGYKTVKSQIEKVCLSGSYSYKKEKTVFETFSAYFVVSAKDHPELVKHYLTLKPSKKLGDMLVAIDAERTRVATLKDEAMETKRKIANLPAYREDLEAMLAETRLSTNETGAAVLAKLEAQLDDDLKLLPTN